MGCNCGKSRVASAYVVKVPGSPEQTVTTEDEAKQLTTGVRGAYYRPVS